MQKVTSPALALLLVGAAGPGCADDPVAVPSATADFDGERAFRDLAAQVALGPRPAGSPGAAQTRQLIRERLRQAGWRVESQVFEVESPVESRSGAPAPVHMENLIGHRDGAQPGLILLVTHYDTKALPGQAFLGANDGASGTAVLLEVARQLGSRPLELGVRLAFVDGEEAFGRSITARDGLYGSRALAERMQQAGELDRVRALILVDMVGDADLNLTPDTSSSPRLRRMLAEEARALGVSRAIDTRAAIPVIDDHTPFQERGLEETLAVIDFQFGSRQTPGPLWHTEGDDLSAVSAQSLNTAGRLVVRLVERIERESAVDSRRADQR